MASPTIETVFSPGDMPSLATLPSGMIALPDGVQMPLDRFLAINGTELCTYPDAQVAVSIPPFKLPKEVTTALQGLFGVMIAFAVSRVIPSEAAAK